MSGGGAIDATLGLKPKTRPRAATHSAGIVCGAECPACHCHHVVEHLVHRRPTRLCGFCGEIWHPPVADALSGDEGQVVDPGLVNPEVAA